MSQTGSGQAGVVTTGRWLPAAEGDRKKAPTGWTPIEEGAAGSVPGQGAHHAGQDGPGQGRRQQRLQSAPTSKGLRVQRFDSEMLGNGWVAADLVLLQPAVRSDAWP